LASIIIEEALRLKESNMSSVAFFFCQNDGQRSTFSSIAKALLTQLLRQNPMLLPYLYDECLESRTVTLSSPQQCSKLLESALQAFQETFIIVDGIDACEERGIKQILQFFASVIAIANSSAESGCFRCLFISREIDDMKKLVYRADVLRLTDQHSEPDIREYTISQSIKIQKKFAITEAAREHIVKVVCKRAERTFLSAVVLFAKLYSKSTVEALSKELRPDSFPPEMVTTSVYATDLDSNMN
jgi:hypothetical protein